MIRAATHGPARQAILIGRRPSGVEFLCFEGAGTLKYSNWWRFGPWEPGIIIYELSFLGVDGSYGPGIQLATVTF